MGSILSFQLQQEVADMFLDRPERDHQSAGNLLVGGRRRKQTQDLLFTWRERLRQRGDGWRRWVGEQWGAREDGLLPSFLVLLVCEPIEQRLSIRNKGRRNTMLLHVRSRKPCLKGLMHRLSSIEKDALISLGLGFGEQAIKNAERLVCGTRRLQSGDVQRQDGDQTSHSRHLLSRTQQCYEQLQGLWIPSLGQKDAHQRQRGAFAAVDEGLPVIGSVLGPVYRPGQVALGQPELDPETFDPWTKEREASVLVHPLHLANGVFSAREIALSQAATRRDLIGPHENVQVLHGCRLLNGDQGLAFRLLQLIPFVCQLSLEEIGIRRHWEWSPQTGDQLVKFLTVVARLRELSQGDQCGNQPPEDLCLLVAILRHPGHLPHFLNSGDHRRKIPRQTQCHSNTPPKLLPPHGIVIQRQVLQRLHETVQLLHIAIRERLFRQFPCLENHHPMVQSVPFSFRTTGLVFALHHLLHARPELVQILLFLPIRERGQHIEC